MLVLHYSIFSPKDKRDTAKMFSVQLDTFLSPDLPSIVICCSLNVM